MTVRLTATPRIFPPARISCAYGLDGWENGDPSAEIAMVTVLLTMLPSVRTCTGTQQQVGAWGGMVNTIWSSPEQHGLRPLYAMLADLPPTKTSVGVGRFAAVGAMLSAYGTGPIPVPHNVMVCPGIAEVVAALMGWSL